MRTFLLKFVLAAFDENSFDRTCLHSTNKYDDDIYKATHTRTILDRA